MWLHDYLELHKNPIWLFLFADKSDSTKEVNHAHQGIEILYVHEGTGEVIIDRQIYQVSRGTLMIFKPFQRHQVRMKTGESKSYIRSLMVFDAFYMDHYLKPFHQLRQFFHELWKGDHFTQIIQIPQPHEMDDMLLKSKQRFASPIIYRDTEERVLLLIQFLEYIRPLIRYSKADVAWLEEGGPEEYAAIDRVVQWIELHYSENMDLEQLSKIAHLSPSYLSSVFHKTIGMCLTDFITDKRIKQACLMLEASGLAIREIGLRVGYSNFSYFCKIFKIHMKMSPQSYRMESRKSVIQ